MNTYVIAEAGVNHNGDPSLALELLEVAAKAGVDAVKFQTFNAKLLATDSADMAEYQKRNIGKSQSQQQMLERLELKLETFEQISERAKTLGIDFISTAFDDESLNFLVNKMNVSTLKVASGEITNAPFLLDHARTNKKIIMSTGMSTMADVEFALEIIAFGWLNPIGNPTAGRLRDAYQVAQMQNLFADSLVLLHCTTQYPTPPDEANLRAMTTLRDTFQVSVGYSDHTQGITIPIAAVALGAEVIEKHFTLDRNMNGPDHAASLEPDELEKMVNAIRITDASLGSPVKGPSASELSNIAIARKSLVANREIKKGDLFTEQNLCVKRPGTGVSPSRYWHFLGHPANRDYATGDLIEE